MSRKKKPYDRQVFRAITLIMQFGINMLVPICLMSAAGIWLDKHFGTDFWMILLFCMGAVAGGYTGWPGQFMKTAMINTLKKINRTVLEMDLGILFLGVSAQIIGAFIAKDEAMYAKSLWFGVLLALVSTYHMYRSLDRALDQPEKTATKMIIRAYVLRYVMLIFFLLVMMKTGVMNPLIFFFTYVICMKVTAFLQPLTHKLCNKLFHETDPIPQAMPEETAEDKTAPQTAEEAEAPKDGEVTEEQQNKQ